MNHYCSRFNQTTSRRDFLTHMAYGVGTAALSSIFTKSGYATQTPAYLSHESKAKRVIFLFQSGGPSHLDLFDPKPEMADRFGQDIPESVFGGQRVTGMVSDQDRFLVVPTKYQFRSAGECGMQMSELLPWTQKIADEICLIRSVYSEAINHDPAITFFQTGSQLPGRPSMGAWVDYGLGTENENLPSFVVMNSVPSEGTADQGLLSRLWGSGFLPGKHQGVQLRGGSDPVLYLANPPGITDERRRGYLDHLASLNQKAMEKFGDPEIETRIAQYEMAYRMQASVPDLADLSDEPELTFNLYGEEARKPGTFAANCLMARRLVERGVRFIQLYHRGWDHHDGLDKRLPVLTRDTDQPSAALVMDLKQRGLLDDTLVIWGGEFGRTPYGQGDPEPDKYGRDHHGRTFSLWMAGGGIKKGHVHGASDEFGFNVVENGVHVHDLQATILHQLGIDHEKLTYRFQGRQYRLTDVHGHVVKEILA
jgi:uncharacterized protein (DUF1501 family)